jgi:hypothetical protein
MPTPVAFPHSRNGPLPQLARGGRPLEDLFHLVIVVLIQARELLGFLGTLQLPANIAVLRAVVRLNPEATVGPQLPGAPDLS